MENILCLKHPMMHGPCVARLQEFLAQINNLDKSFKIDGIYGKQTEYEVKRVQSAAGIKEDGIVGPDTWLEIDFLVTRKSYSPAEMFIDTRGTHKKPRLYGYKRNLAVIDGITLHQTGCTMPSDPHAWKNLNAHIGITRNGQVVIVNDPTAMIWHAQGLSQSTIGIEIEGNYCGLKNTPATLWAGGGGPSKLSAQMIDSTLFVIDWLFKDMEKLGHRLLRGGIFAHRQSSKSRPADPGEEIWKTIAIPCIEKYGIERKNDFCVGTGNPIPKEWDPSSCHRYGIGAKI